MVVTTFDRPAKMRRPFFLKYPNECRRFAGQCLDRENIHSRLYVVLEIFYRVIDIFCRGLVYTFVLDYNIFVGVVPIE